MRPQPAVAPIHGLHHFACRCRDAEETRRFDEDRLGLPLWQIIQSDDVPSTGKCWPYAHSFFRMGDRSCVAFFDLGDEIASDPSPDAPPWVNHLALRVDTVAVLEAVKAPLKPQRNDRPEFAERARRAPLAG